MGHVTSRQLTTENDVENKIKIVIKNETMNLNKSLNESISRASTKALSAVNLQAKSQNSSGNNANINGADIENTTLDFNQYAKVDATTEQVMTVISSQQAFSDFASNMSNQIKDSTSTDNNLQTQMNTVAKLINATKTDEGLASVAGKVVDAAKSMFSIVSDDEVSQTQINRIRNSVEQDITNSTTNETDISNISQQITENLMSYNLQASCTSANDAMNNISISNSKFKNDDINIAQTAIVTSFNKCIINATNSTGIINKMFNQNITQDDMDTFNKNTSAVTQINKEELTNSVETTDTTTTIIIVCVICACLAGIAYYYFQTKGSDNSAGDNSAGDDDNGDVELSTIIKYFNINKYR